MKPLSYTELIKWETDRLRWEQEYLLGMKEPCSFPMERGKFIHNMLFTGARDKEEDFYTPDQRRVHDKIYKTFGILVEDKEGTPIEGWTHEKMVKVQISNVPTIGFWDGLKGTTLMELKTGSRLWTKEEADEHEQIPFYLLQAANKDIDITKILLVSFNTNNGKGACFELEPNFEAMLKMEQRIEDAYSQMIKEGVWFKRLQTKI